ncbi:MAG: c-type cytochrome [Flavobacteriaceae bacterium]
MKRLYFIFPLVFLMACQSNNKKSDKSTGDTKANKKQVDSSEIMHNDELYKAKTGVGPIKDEVVLDDQIDKAMADKGKKLFNNECASCHRIQDESVGPALGGVLGERSPQWVMNMILNPREMVEKDVQAQSMKAEYETQMVDTHLSEEEARSIVEYLRNY